MSRINTLNYMIVDVFNYSRIDASPRNLYIGRLFRLCIYDPHCCFQDLTPYVSLTEKPGPVCFSLVMRSFFHILVCPTRCSFHFFLISFSRRLDFIFYQLYKGRTLHFPFILYSWWFGIVAVGFLSIYIAIKNDISIDFPLDWLRYLTYPLFYR